jgi:hypothetical protein
MNKLLSRTTRALPAALVFAAAAALSSGAHADDASKKALAVKLAQLQQKNDSAPLAGQLTDSVMQQQVAKWLPQIRSRVSTDQQKEVSDKLNAALKQFGDSTNQAIQAQAVKSAQDALVPLFMDKLNKDDLKAIVTYLQTPASAKFAALSGQALNAWAAKIKEGADTAVQGYAKNFDDAAGKIISAAAASSAPAASASAPVASASSASADASASAPADSASADASASAPASSASADASASAPASSASADASASAPASSASDAGQ